MYLRLKNHNYILIHENFYVNNRVDGNDMTTEQP